MSRDIKDDSNVESISQKDPSVWFAWFRDAVRQVQLAWRLFLDQRVPLWTKVIPPAALGYVLFPLDILPDMALGLGQLDDAAVVLLGLKLFIELAPPKVVREHLRVLGTKVDEWRVIDDTASVIEGNYSIEDPERQASKETASGLESEYSSSD